LLLPIQPAGQSGKKNPHGGDVDHRGSLHYRPRFEAGHRSAELWDTTGSIEITVKNEKDEAVIAAVRNHLRSIAADFARGAFDKPFQIHGEVPTGVHEMQADKDSIAYRYEDLPQGGAVRIVTTNARAQEAVHAFLRYQITEHHTGDPTEVKR
jgi:hypothetical protein